MLLAIDVGNTNITLGVFDGDHLLGDYRLTTAIPRTSDEYGMTIRSILNQDDIHHRHRLHTEDGSNINDEFDPVLPKTYATEGRKEITHCIIASVVPAVMHSLTSAIIKYFGVRPLIVEAGIKTGIKIVTENPKQIGADRIVDLAGAYGLYGGPLIVIDFGTATTYDLIEKDGSFSAAVTAPGIRMSAKALWSDTAKLPEVEIIKPPTILAKETISSMQAGLVFGQIGQTEYIITKMKQESGLKDIRVIATGGLGGLISQNTKMIDIYRPTLTLEGMRFIHERNSSN